MKNNPNNTKDTFAAEVTAFVDDFVANATPAEMDRFLEEGVADFYNQVVAPVMVAAEIEHRIIRVDAVVSKRRLSRRASFALRGWQAQGDHFLVPAERPDLALAA